jgi:hypothetical protein
MKHQTKMARHTKAQLTEVIRVLVDALRMKGAPKAPCRSCSKKCGKLCLCQCHSVRAEYVMGEFDKAIRVAEEVL